MNKLIVGLHPHIRAKENTQTIMFDVLIALLPCVLAGIFFFGYRVVVLLGITILSCLLFEWVACKMFQKESSLWDLSAVVSAVILTLNLPVGVPLWLPIVGSLFMIFIVKMCFGGLGQNFMNPAAAGRVFLLVCFPFFMTQFVEPFTRLGLFSVDAVSSATPLALAKAHAGADFLPSTIALYLGQHGGSLGETSGLAILLGFFYLLWRRVIKWEVPTIFVGTVFVFSLLCGKDPVFHVLTGGLLFGAVFMATDYVTSPISRVGKMIFAVGLGVLTCVIRFWGGYPEGVSLAIIFMNVLVPYLDKIKPVRFGEKSGKTKRKN